MATPTVVIGGTESGVGKTTLAVGLMRLLASRGETVQPFKVGPDFIDPLHHHAATGRFSYNLDGWLTGREGVREIYGRAVEGADVAVVEGVMGMYDGYGPDSSAGSTAEVAAAIEAPVVLVVDAWSMARSAAAVVEGFANFDASVDVAGVVFNRTAGEGHLELLGEAVETSTDVAVLGGIPRDEAFDVPERHLGLELPSDDEATDGRLDELAERIDEGLDVDRLLDCAGSGPNLESPAMRSTPVRTADDESRLGVARGPAFCFYYRSNIERLEELGCRLVPFSPLADEWPEELDGVYLGGGYPEEHVEELADAERASEGMLEAIESGLPVYAECGGLMWLGEWIEGRDGERHSMVGALPVAARMTETPTIAYVEARAMESAPFFPVGEVARGHVFHHAEIVELEGGSERRAPLELTGRDGDPEPGGWCREQTLASWVHLHFGSRPAFAEAFAAACRENG